MTQNTIAVKKGKFVADEKKEAAGGDDFVDFKVSNPCKFGCGMFSYHLPTVGQVPEERPRHSSRPRQVRRKHNKGGKDGRPYSPTTTS